jgi:hypothetical protein
MVERCAICIESGAVDVWIVDGSGEVARFNGSGTLHTSALFPAFPAHLHLP